MNRMGDFRNMMCREGSLNLFEAESRVVVIWDAGLCVCGARSTIRNIKI